MGVIKGEVARMRSPQVAGGRMSGNWSVAVPKRARWMLAALTASTLLLGGPALAAVAGPAAPAVRTVDPAAPPVAEPADPAPPSDSTPPSDPGSTTDPTPSDPAPSDPTSTDPVPSDPTPSDPTPSNPTPSNPTETAGPTTPPTSGGAPIATPTPGVTPPASTPTGAPDLGVIDFATREDMQRVAGDPAAVAQFARQVEAQLKLIDDALREAQTKVDQTGAAYDLARTAAEEARGTVDQLEADATILRDNATLSDETVGMLVQRMRSGSYVVPPELGVFLSVDPHDDLLYQYGVVSALSVNESELSALAEATAIEIDRLLDSAEVARDEAERLEDEAETAKTDAVAAQQWLTSQLNIAENNQNVLADILRELGYNVAPTSYLSTMIATRQTLLASPPGAVNALGFAAPMANATISSPFGPRTHPVNGGSAMHYGTDFVTGGTCGVTIYAVAAGTVTYSGWLGTYGNHIEIMLADGTRISYSHIADGGLGVRVGERVVAGQAIALAGTTGLSTGCHLHLEVVVAGQPIDAMGWLTARGL